MITTTRLRGIAAAGAALGLVAGFGTIAHAETTPTPSASDATPVVETVAPEATGAAPEAAATEAAPAVEEVAQPRLVSVDPTSDACASTTPLTLFNINDFHGRILDAGKLFTPVEQLRATQADVILGSAGDNVGATIFESFINEDNPAIDILNAAGLEVSAPGNHEFDRGYADLRDRIEQRAAFPYVVANIEGTDMAPYTVITTESGIRVAYIGADVSELSTLVSPAGIAGLTISGEVQAVNKYADQIRANDEADVIVAEVHNEITEGYNKNVDVVFNGHTHATYAKINAAGIPVVQAASYATKLGRVDLKIGEGNVICGTPAPSIVDPAAAADTSFPAIAKIEQIAADAKASAAEVGAQVIGQATADITRGIGADGKESRAVESTATDMVANAFFDIAGGDPDTIIGMQNPGGTRADIEAGDITYAQSAAVLPFANTIMTTQITGAQLKTVLEQQWQRDANGNVPSRPYLQLGLSDNVTYTYYPDAQEGNHIRGIWINGNPVDPAKLYTVASGSFLISGGDNFFELGKGINPTDTGKSDLEAFVNWVKDTKKGQLSPDPERQAVSIAFGPGGGNNCTGTARVTLGQPSDVAPDTLDFSNGVAPEATVTAFVGGVEAGTFAVVDGIVQAEVQIPFPGVGGELTFTTGNGTVVHTETNHPGCTPTITLDPTNMTVENSVNGVKYTSGPWIEGIGVKLELVEPDGDVVVIGEADMPEADGSLAGLITLRNVDTDTAVPMAAGTYTVRMTQVIDGQDVVAEAQFVVGDGNADDNTTSPSLPRTGAAEGTSSVAVLGLLSLAAGAAILRRTK